MCLTLAGKVVSVDKKKVVVDVGNRKIHVKVNPSVTVNKGDGVIIFKDMILEKVIE